MSEINKIENMGVGKSSTDNGKSIFSGDWWKDPKNKVTAFVVGLLSIYPIYLIGTYVIPWLKTVIWDTTALLAGVGVLAVLLMILTNKRFWRAIKYFSEFIGKYTLGLVIELDPFNILEIQIEEAQKDRIKVKKEGDRVRGKKMELEEKIKNKTNLFEQAVNKVKLIQKNINLVQNGKSNENLEYLIADYDVEASKLKGYKDYIDELTPITDNLGYLEEYCKKIYKLSGSKIEKAKIDLELGKDKYSSIMSGLSVARASWKALMGNDEMNQDAEQALRVIQQRVSESLGEMKNTMELTSDVIRSLERDNTVRAMEGINIIKELDILGGGNSYVSNNHSNWGEDLNMTPQSGYGHLLLDEPHNNPNTFDINSLKENDYVDKILISKKKIN